MASVTEIMQLCRLCLVKDQVNIPIFEEQGDIRQIFLKISACLPVKVSREDNLPKKICDGCSYKLEILYQFWNTSANSEKQLLKWLSQVGIEKTPAASDKVASKAQQHSIGSDNVVLKQEVVDLGDNQGADDITSDDLNVSSDAQDYILQQQQLPYQPVTFEFQDGFTEGEATSSAAGPSATVTSEVPKAAPKRKRRAAAMKALPPQIDSEDEDDVDIADTKIAKTEEQSDDSGGEDPEPTTFVGLPSTSTDNEQPGPSGVGKGAAEAPLSDHDYTEFLSIVEIKIKEETAPPRGKHPQEKRHICTRCPITFQTKKELKNHQNTHLQKIHPCTICGRMFKSPFLVKSHERSHIAKKRFKCTVCLKMFKTVVSVQTHMKTHTKDYKYKCGDCDRGFYTKAGLKNHRESAHLNITFTCSDCNKVFRNKGYFKQHLETHKSDYKVPIFTCLQCNAKLTSPQSYGRHMKSHKMDDQYICDVCGKHLAAASSLRLHMLIHTGEKPFACDVCEKRFNKKILLKIHKRIHTKEKPYSCDLCGKSFTQRPTLTIHKRLHTGEKPYTCEICKKCFVSKSTLKLHSKRHGISLADMKVTQKN